MVSGKYSNKASIINTRNYLMDHYDIRRNLVSGEVEYCMKGAGNFEPVNENSLYIERREQGIKATIQDVIIFLSSKYVAEHNPLLTYFRDVQTLWNPGLHGDYIEKFSGYVKALDQERFNRHLKKWLVRTVACALDDSYYNKQAFILVHDRQNSGKTTWTRFIVPPRLKNYCVENLSLDKDSLIAICENMIGILDELSTISKVEINGLKSVLSKSEVKVRHPYERKARLTPRRISFVGSTNRKEFLVDETGNVRWLCFEIERIDWNYARDIDIEILWSQAYRLYQQGFKHELTPEEIEENEQANQHFRVIPPEMELILKYYAPGTSEDHDAFYITTDFLTYLSERIDGRIRLNVITLGRALKILGFEKAQKYGHEGKAYPLKGYYIKFNEVTM